MTSEQEMEVLLRERDMPLEELKALYANMPLDDSDDGNDAGEDDADVGNDDEAGIVDGDDGEDPEFVGEDESDDELTLAAEEAMSRDISVDEEIELLKKEGEMSIEELRALYATTSEPEGDDDDDVVEEEEMGIDDTNDELVENRIADDGAVAASAISEEGAVDQGGDFDDFFMLAKFQYVCLNSLFVIDNFHLLLFA
jgi:hypothetical protein